MRNITVSEGKAGHVTSEILPELKKALDAAKTSKGLKSELTNRFGTRTDVAYNLATNQGRAAYEATPGFASSGMSTGDLMRYATAVAERSPIPTRSFGNPSTTTALTTPVYARSYSSAFPSRDATTARTVGSATTPFSAPRVSVDEVVAIGKRASAHAEKTGTAVTEISAPSVRSSANTARTSEAIPTPIPMKNTTPTAPTIPRTVSSTNTNTDGEVERLKRIEANYERDKAMLAKEKAPALARSASHDVGHAEGTNGRVVSDTAEIKKLTRAMEREVANRIVEKSK